jgi:oxygen-independent coproporphyrinogen-3 oxidase
MEDVRSEALFLGLRTRNGIDTEAFSRLYDYDLLAEKGAVLRRFEQEGIVTIQGGRIRPTRRGLALADSLALI